MALIMIIGYITSRYIPGKKTLIKRFDGNKARLVTLDIYYILQLIAIIGDFFVIYADNDMLRFTRVVEDAASDTSYSYSITIFFIMFVVVYTFTIIAKHTPLTEEEKDH